MTGNTPIIVVLALAGIFFLTSLWTGIFSTAFVSWNRKSNPRDFWLAFGIALAFYSYLWYLVIVG